MKGKVGERSSSFHKARSGTIINGSRKSGLNRFFKVATVTREASISKELLLERRSRKTKA